MSRIFFFFLLLLSHSVLAQYNSTDEDLKYIDSLIENSNFDQAQQRTDSLFELYQPRKNDVAKYLELKYRLALIHDRQDKTPVNTIVILLELLNEAEKNGLHSLSFHTELLLALSYEKSDNLDLTKQYLNNANNLYLKYKLASEYSTYCIRKSSYFRYLNELDSMLFYANTAKEYAQKYNKETDLMDSYILLSVYASRKKDYQEKLQYQMLLLDYHKRKHNHLYLAVGYLSLSSTYMKIQKLDSALIYVDSAYALYYNQATVLYKALFSETKFEVYDAMGNTDSALYYLKQLHENYKIEVDESYAIKAKNLEETYQNQKKEATINQKNNQMIIIVSLLALIVIAAILLFFQNRKINARNKTINEQLETLKQTLHQKQVLLSELQHRVKNNLQHVISILEIQKESVDFNNIEELIRGNQNRIHSMALLHKKLNVTDNVHEVDLCRYITELSELVKDSYDANLKKVRLAINCTVSKISLEKALPIGLIIVELVSNSMKHAFKKKQVGIININVTDEVDLGHIRLQYSDDGSGFDFYANNDKGLGVELIKGLVDQLKGSFRANNNNGFELNVYFK